MSEPNNSLNILIRILTENLGGEEAKRVLKDVGLSGVQAHAETAQAAEKGTEQAEKLHVKHSALHKLFHMIGAQTAPELGQALNASMLGPIGAVLALGAAVEYVIRLLEAQKKKTEELATAQAELTVASWDAQRTAIGDAKDEAEKFATALGKVHEKISNLKDTEEEEKAHFDAVIEQNKKLIESEEQVALARADGDKEAIAAVKERFAVIKATFDLQAGADAVAGMEAYLGKAKETQAADEKTAHAASIALQKGVLHPDGTSAAGDAGAAQAIDNREKGKEPFLKKEAEDQLREIETWLQRAKGSLNGVSADEIEKMVRKEESRTGGEGPSVKIFYELEENQKLLQENSEWLRQYNAVLAKLKKDAEEKSARVASDAADVHAREHALAIARDRQGVATAGAAQRAPIDAVAGTLNPRAIQAMQSGQLNGPNQNDVQKLLSALGFNNTQIQNIFNGLMNHTIEQNKVIEEMQRRMDQFGHQMVGVKMRPAMS